MNGAVRKTRICSFETLDEKLRDAIRSHGTEYGLQDLETDVLMCCETLSAWQEKGFHGGIRTSLSAIYVTPRWLVWADGSRDQEAMAGTAQLKHIDVGDAHSAGGYSISPDQGLSVSGRTTRRTNPETLFLVLDSEAEGRQFRRVLQDALLASRRSGRFSKKAASHAMLLEEGDRATTAIKDP
ncbi:MAG: hypothetical protein ACM3XO_05235 [Bacteroidota bacterium]